MRKLSVLFLAAQLLLLFGCAAIQRKLLFYPSHHNHDNGLVMWKNDERIIGYSRQVPHPENIWLMLHGNGGQAADRAYAIPAFSERDSVFILEYPGYGARAGRPSRMAFDASAAEAYALLRAMFPQRPICVMGESIGSGPACMLANQSRPPEKIVLVVPFDTLKRVAADHLLFFPVGLLVGDGWDNVRALSVYKGPVEIFGAAQDAVIPITHAKILANSISSAKFHLIEGGHNDWSNQGRVEVRYP